MANELGCARAMRYAFYVMLVLTVLMIIAYYTASCETLAIWTAIGSLPARCAYLLQVRK